MKRVLITGFEPFGGEEINPSWEAVRLLPDRIGECSLTKMLVPVVFTEAAERVIRKAREVSADVILSIGQAGGRAGITPEAVAINLCYAKIPDNAGNQPKDEAVMVGGESAYFSTLPVRRIAEAIAEAGIRSEVSYSAGAYVCNDLLYRLLAEFDGSGVGVGFIHVPYVTEQNKEPSMSLDDIVKGLTVAIENL
jgi:pyroglutamyl-peptidase